MKKKKIILLALAALSATILGACSSESEKLRDSHIENYQIYLSKGEQLNAIKSLQQADYTIPFSSEEDFAQYTDTLGTHIMQYFYSEFELTKTKKDSKDYAGAVAHINNIQDLMQSTDFDYTPELENISALKEEVTALHKGNIYFNEFYSTYSAVIATNDELIRKYNTILDQVYSKQLTPQNALASKTEIIEDVKTNLGVLETIDTTKFDTNFNNEYLNHFNQLSDFTFNLSIFLTNIDVNFETYTQKASNLNAYKKELLQIKQNYLNFGISNKFEIDQN